MSISEQNPANLSKNRSPLFIVGSNHSGTTVLLRILGYHSRICAIPFESNFALKWPNPCPEAKRFFEHCDTFAHRMLKARWLEKTPSHILRLKEIFNYFPDGKVLLILRDGRDVAYSFQHRNYTVEQGIEHWKMGNRAGQPFWNDSRVQVVRYENLVTDFEKTVRSAMAFVGEEYEDSLSRYHERPLAYFSSNMERPPNRRGGENARVHSNWQINQPIFDGRGTWSRLSQAEKDVIKNKAGQMLIEYGYTTDLNW